MAIGGNAREQPAALPAGGDVSRDPPPPGTSSPAPRPHQAARRAKAARLIRAVRDSDHTAVEQAVLQLSASRRLFAPLALGVGALVTLIDGVNLLFTNWRLTLIQVLPAMWIWLALLDLKAHLLHGKSFHVVRGPVLIPIVLAIAAITAACFFLNAVFAFAIAWSGRPMIRPAFTQARSHLAVVLGSGARRRWPRRVDHGPYPLGVVVVRDLAERRHRGDDDLLCRRAGPSHRHEDHHSKRDKLPPPSWAARSAR